MDLTPCAALPKIEAPLGSLAPALEHQEALLTAMVEEVQAWTNPLCALEGKLRALRAENESKGRECHALQLESSDLQGKLQHLTAEVYPPFPRGQPDHHPLHHHSLVEGGFYSPDPLNRVWVI